MSISLDLSFTKKFINEQELRALRQKADDLYENLLPTLDMAGWLKPDDSAIDDIKRVAAELSQKSDVVVSIGVGGSYLGAKAVVEALKPRAATKIVFAGNSLSARSLQQAIDDIDGKDFSIIIISKSGTTLEPALAFRVFRKFLIEKYGYEEANRRIVAVTDPDKGVLRDMITKNGWQSFSVPSNIGGRFSVLTAAQLLTIATAGIDIRELIEGAKQAATDRELLEAAKDYAATRNVLYQSNKTIGIMSTFEPSLHYLTEWWRQLFGESEGKASKGIFPTVAVFTTDLHSIGQFIQDGKRDVYETFIKINRPPVDFMVPAAIADYDGIDYLSGKTIEFINAQAFEGTKQAHFDGGVPVLELSIDEISSRELGALIYFFELSCAISALLLGVDPFDQPGVEAYKQNMSRLLGRE